MRLSAATPRGEVLSVASMARPRRVHGASMACPGTAVPEAGPWAVPGGVVVRGAAVFRQLRLLSSCCEHNHRLSSRPSIHYFAK